MTLYHLKTFLILIISIFSFCFLGIYNIKALNFQGVNITDDFLNTAWSYFDNKSYNEISGVTYDDWRTRPFKKEDFNSIVIYYASNSGGILNIAFLPTDELTPKKSYLEFPSTSMPDYGYWAAIPVAQYFISNSSFTTRFNSTLTYYPDSQYYIANFDCTFKDVFYPKDFEFDLNPPKKPFNINFHLNGGTITDNINDIVFQQDFNVSLYNYEVESFVRGLDFSKSNMVFDGMYYDNTYNNVFNIDDIITSDIDLYIKWRFSSVDDFLDNTTFNSYTFDTDYDYAIISKGDFDGDIYLGLNFLDYSLELYEYRPDLNSYKDTATVCLLPVYSKNNMHYYNVNTLYTSNYQIAVLPRSVFENGDNFNYNFLLTDNAYVKYTNDLSHSIIVDKNGNEINTNLKDSYELGQSYLKEYNNTESNFNVMKKYLNQLKSMNSVWNDCFDFFYTSLPSIVRSFMIFVFNIIMILIFLRLVGWK